MTLALIVFVTTVAIFCVALGFFLGCCWSACFRDDNGPPTHDAPASCAGSLCAFRCRGGRSRSAVARFGEAGRAQKVAFSITILMPAVIAADSSAEIATRIIVSRQVILR
jgi:hypothetical protein